MRVAETCVSLAAKELPFYAVRLYMESRASFRGHMCDCMYWLLERTASYLLEQMMIDAE